ncbi:MAG: hypothetical protein RBT49_18305 [Bacteroidales bacterium]|nr:hypothetical protein [Bacteroidales bacterium]
MAEAISSVILADSLAHLSTLGVMYALSAILLLKVQIKEFFYQEKIFLLTASQSMTANGLGI